MPPGDGMGVSLFHASSIVASIVARGMEPYSMNCSRCGDPLFGESVKLVALEEPIVRWVHVSCLPLRCREDGQIVCGVG